MNERPANGEPMHERPTQPDLRDDAEWRDTLEGLTGQPKGVPSPDPGFREALRLRTAHAVQARRRRSSALRAAAAVVLFASGVFVGSWSGSTEAPSSASPTGGAAEQTGPTPPVESPRPALPDPTALERTLASADPQERSERWTRFGDAYLDEDPSAALYCYRRSLAETASDVPLEVSTEDSWLLKALKAARN